MSTILKSRTTAASRMSDPDIEKQFRRGKAVLRELKPTLEDLEARLELATAKKRNAGKPGTSLRDAARELACN